MEKEVLKFEVTNQEDALLVQILLALVEKLGGEAIISEVDADAVLTHELRLAMLENGEGLKLRVIKDGALENVDGE